MRRLFSVPPIPDFIYYNKITFEAFDAKDFLQKTLASKRFSSKNFSLERSMSMQLNLSGQHIEITEALRNYVSNKMERLERHFDHVTNMHVVLSVEKLRQKAEATLHVSGANLFANAEHEDMYAAIDALTDKLDRQIKKHKEKLQNHRQSDGGIKAHQSME